MTKSSAPPKRGRGRPPLPDGEVLNEILQVRVSDADAALIQGALRKGETVSTIGRKLLVAWAKRRAHE